MDRNSKFELNLYISNAQNVKICRHVRINKNVVIQGFVAIGHYEIIVPNVAIHSSKHLYDNPSTPMVFNNLSELQKVRIKDDVWIGCNSVILPALSIGKGNIIGANPVVNKDVLPYTIVGGVPAKFVKKRLEI